VNEKIKAKIEAMADSLAGWDKYKPDLRFSTSQLKRDLEDRRRNYVELATPWAEWGEKLSEVILMHVEIKELKTGQRITDELIEELYNTTYSKNILKEFQEFLDKKV